MRTAYALLALLCLVGLGALCLDSWHIWTLFQKVQAWLGLSLFGTLLVLALGLFDLGGDDDAWERDFTV